MSWPMTLQVRRHISWNASKQSRVAGSWELPAVQLLHKSVAAQYDLGLLRISQGFPHITCACTVGANKS